VVRSEGATPLADLLVNVLPLDSYAIAWDQTQLALLVAYLLVLPAPFVFAGALRRRDA
jgi:hypothetical protein